MLCTVGCLYELNILIEAVKSYLSIENSKHFDSVCATKANSKYKISIDFAQHICIYLLSRKQTVTPRISDNPDYRPRNFSTGCE